MISHVGHAEIIGRWAVGIGKYGVAIFFVLSAYLMCYMADKALPERSNYWLSYLKSRFFRIFPLYFVVCSLFLVGGYFSGLFEFGVADYLSNIFLIDGYRHLWAIPVEFKFYLVFPLLFMIAWGMDEKGRIKALGWLWLSSFLISFFGIWDNVSLLKYLNLFVAGMIAYTLSGHLSVMDVLTSNKKKIYLIVTLLFFVSNPAVFSVLFFPVKFDFLHDYLFVFGVAAALLILLIRCDKRLKVMLENNLLVFIGSRSYSLYLLHPFVLYAVKQAKLGWFSLIVFILVVLAVSEVTYKKVEIPFMRFAKS